MNDLSGKDLEVLRDCIRVNPDDSYNFTFPTAAPSYYATEADVGTAPDDVSSPITSTHGTMGVYLAMSVIVISGIVICGLLTIACVGDCMRMIVSATTGKKLDSKTSYKVLGGLVEYSTESKTTDSKKKSNRRKTTRKVTGKKKRMKKR